jgi:hypothetical protein
MATIGMFFVMALFLAIGIGFVYLLSKALEKADSRESEYVRLSGLYGTQQLARRDERIEILNKIGRPECPDGTYSRRQQRLWDKYHGLEKIGKAQTTAEITHLVETRGYISDYYADIIDGER